MPINKPTPKKYKNYSMPIMTFGILTLIALGVGAYYGYTQYIVYNNASTALEKERQSEGSIASELKKVKDTYENINKAYGEDNKSRQDSISAVFPPTDAYTELTRQIEKYENDNSNELSNPLFIGSLSFSNPEQDEESPYSVLPFSLTLQTTRKGFDDFLKYVENSGSIDDRSRILDIQSIAISFPNQERQAFEEEQVQLLSVSLAMNSYFQKP